MMTYLPAFYSDELLYSLLARYYVKSGQLFYTFIAQEIFGSSKCKPSIEFINRFSPETLSVITKNYSLSQIIMKHTMFPYYGRFIPESRRNNAYDAMLSMNPVYRNYLVIPKRKENDHRCLRYCPQCVKEDREKYGETYWHRTHQLPGMDICPVHKCFLRNSVMITNNQTSPIFCDADSHIPETEDIKYCESNIEISLAQYMYDVFQSEIDMDGDITIGEYFQFKMRDKQINIKKFFNDFTDYYKALNNNRLTELWQIQGAIMGCIVTFPEVCMIGMFLNIPPAELIYATNRHFSCTIKGKK